MSERPPRKRNKKEKPLSQKEAYGEFKKGIVGLEKTNGTYAEIENARKAALANVKYAKRQGDFTTPELRTALEAEAKRLTALKREVKRTLSPTIPGTSFGTLPFRVRRETEREKKKTFIEHVDTLVLGEKVVRRGKKRISLENPVTTRPMKLDELEARIASIKKAARLNNPTGINKKMILVERPRGVVPSSEIMKTVEIVEAEREKREAEEAAIKKEFVGKKEIPEGRSNAAISPPIESPLSSSESVPIQKELEKAYEKFKNVASRFTLREGFEPFSTREEAERKLNNALYEYLSLYQRCFGEFALNLHTQNLGTVLQTLFLEREIKIMDSRTSAVEELEGRGVAHEMQKLKKKKQAGWLRGVFVALATLAGAGAVGVAGKAALDAQQEAAGQAKSSNIEDLFRPAGAPFRELAISPDGGGTGEPYDRAHFNEIFEEVRARHERPDSETER